MPLDRGEPVEVYNTYPAAVKDLPKWEKALKRLKLKEPYTVRVHIHMIGEHKFYGIFAEPIRKPNRLGN